MSVSRRVLAVPPLAAIVAAACAASASAGTLTVPPCVTDYRVVGQDNLTINGAGYTPGSFVLIQSTTASNPTPTTVASATADAAGNFLTKIGPLLFNRFDTYEQSYTLTASETNNPANVTAPVSFKQVRFGFSSDPERARPSSKVRYTARGFLPGRAVYAHFRFRGKTVTNVRIGVASSPCGIATRRIRLLPARVRFGDWFVYMDHARSYSPNTARTNPLLSARGKLTISRTFG